MNNRIIHPEAVYFGTDLVRDFGFTSSTFRTARRRSGLRAGKRMGKLYVLGIWLLEWFAAGELSSRQPPGTVSSGRRPATNKEVR